MISANNSEQEPSGEQEKLAGKEERQENRRRRGAGLADSGSNNRKGRCYWLAWSRAQAFTPQELPALPLHVITRHT